MGQADDRASAPRTLVSPPPTFTGRSRLCRLRVGSQAQMIDAFRELVPYSQTLSQNIAFDAYFTGHESGSRHA